MYGIQQKPILITIYNNDIIMAIENEEIFQIKNLHLYLKEQVKQEENKTKLNKNERNKEQK
jgi:hypothetical protein